MTNKPVILTRDEEGVYRIHISSEILDSLPNYISIDNYDSLLLRVGDEGLKSSWGYLSAEYGDYRSNKVSVSSIEEAKEISKIVRTIVVALAEKTNPEEIEQIVGEIDF
jgi:hypothetical protein